MLTIGIIIAVIVLIILWGVGIFNRLVVLRNQVKNAWSQIDVQLQRRYDLIPNLIETVKGYMTYEKSTLQAVVEARNQAAALREQIQKSGVPSEEAMKGLMGAEATLRTGLGNIFALAENYPQLKASETMQNLQEELKRALIFCFVTSPYFFFALSHYLVQLVCCYYCVAFLSHRPPL